MANAKPNYQLKIMLAEIRPPIWRRVEVPDCRLSKLRRIIQVCMGWRADCMWAFKVGSQRYADDIFDDSAGRTTLSQLVLQDLKAIRYILLCWPNWEHAIQVEKVLEGDPQAEYPKCVNGRRACPPANCGGPWGYKDLLEIIQNLNYENREWILKRLGAEEIDPETFDQMQVNVDLRKIR